MKQLWMITYRYREHLGAEDLRKLTAKFTKTGTAPDVIAQYERLDGKGGFVLANMPEDPESGYEFTIQYGPWMEFEYFPIATMEEAFPVIQRVYG